MESFPGIGYSLGEANESSNRTNDSPDSLEKLNLADLMRFADFGPGLGIVDPVNLGENLGKSPATDGYDNRKRKRPRSRKTKEEVESQRMTHIAVERNRRKRMNEHLRILRSLMPTSYVQRGDQASIIGGAIEFVRELEQLAQCLESRIGGFPNDQMQLVEENENGISEEKAEIKSRVAEVEVKLLGVDGYIKILSRTRPGQLIKTIELIEDLQLNIVQTSVSTVDQMALYSFDFKINGDASRLTAEDMARSVQQMMSDFIS